MIKGNYYQGSSSKAYECELIIDENGHAKLSGLESETYYPLDSLVISPRVGKTARYVRFPNNGRFETLNNDGIDHLLSLHTENEPWFIAYNWESKLRFIAVAAVIMCIFLFAMVKTGIPAASKNIAHRLPAHFSTSLAENVLIELDDLYFEKSELSPERQSHIRGLFKELIPENSELEYSLKFRKSEPFGANAIALPNGTIVLTDDLVNVASYDEEIIAVLLHEIGHIVHKHSLRNAIEATGIYALYAWVTGDVELSSTVLFSLSAILLKAQYSRDHESEADLYSLEELLAHEINPNYFPSIMNKISTASAAVGKDKDKNTSSSSETDTTSTNTEGEQNYIDIIFNYLATHPSTEIRNKRFSESAEEYNYPTIDHDHSIDHDH